MTDRDWRMLTEEHPAIKDIEIWMLPPLPQHVTDRLKMEKLYQVNLPYACFGIITVQDIVVEAAPIAKWMQGKTIYFVEQWVKSKGGTIR